MPDSIVPNMIRKRGSGKHYISYFGIVICCVLLYNLYDASCDSFGQLIVFLLVPSYILKEPLRRCIVFCEEFLYHFKTRYSRNWKSVYRSCFNNSNLTGGALISAGAMVLYALLDDTNVQFWDCFYANARVWVFIAGLLAFWDIIALDSSNSMLNQVFNDTPSMAEIWADAAYTSYLKNVLETIVERIEKYEAEHGVHIPLKKLVLQVPGDCDVRKTFDAHNENIEYVGDLGHILMDQGANINRRYKNPVYKINKRNNEPLYVVMEQPSSLLTFWKLKNTIPPHIIEFQKNVFLSTLQKHLENDPCVMLFYDGKIPLSVFIEQEISRLLAIETESYRIDV